MLRTFLQKHGIEPQTIAVGVSGGSDSLGLVLMANQELRPLGFKIVALTVDHRLRPQSSAEAEYVASVMHTYDIEHHILVWKEDPKPVNGVEEAAREARYALIGDWCRQHGVKYVMTAHHLLDQAETFFMNLHRGSGLNGLCGMSEVSRRADFNLLRPLLATDPSQMKDFLKQAGIKWVEDESNNNEELLRVKIRHFLPALTAATGITPDRIAETMTRLRSSRCYLEEQAAEIIGSRFENWHNYAYACEPQLFAQLDTEIGFRVLAQILKRIAGTDYPPRAQKILSLLQRLNKTDFKAATLGHCQIRRQAEKLWFMPQEQDLGVYRPALWKKYIKTDKRLAKKKLPLNVRVFLINSLTVRQRGQLES